MTIKTDNKRVNEFVEYVLSFYRTLTYIYDDSELTERKDAIVCLYHQWGDPESWGVRLNKFLGHIALVDGYCDNHKAGTHANGMGCLAAQLIASEKTSIGGCYISKVAEDVDNLYIEYIYEIWPDRLKIIDTDGDRVLYDGSWGAYVYVEETE